MNIHENSLFAWAQERFSGRLSERARLVLDYIKSNGPCTDRQVAMGLGFHDMNSVRPRATELVKRGILVEIGNAIDQLTGKRVRRLKANGL